MISVYLLLDSGCVVQAAVCDTMKPPGSRRDCRAVVPGAGSPGPKK